MCVNLRKGQGVDMFPRTENKVDLFPRTGTIVTSLSRYRAMWRLSACCQGNLDFMRVIGIF